MTYIAPFKFTVSSRAFTSHGIFIHLGAIWHWTPHPHTDCRGEDGTDSFWTLSLSWLLTKVTPKFGNQYLYHDSITVIPIIVWSLLHLQANAAVCYISLTNTTLRYIQRDIISRCSYIAHSGSNRDMSRVTQYTQISNIIMLLEYICNLCFYSIYLKHMAVFCQCNISLVQKAKIMHFTGKVMCNLCTFWIIVHVICQCKVNITISAKKASCTLCKTEVEMAAYDFQMAHYHTLCISLDYYTAAHIVYMCIYPAIWIYIQLPTTTVDCIKESLTSRIYI